MKPPEPRLSEDQQSGLRPDLKSLIALRAQARRLDLTPRGRVLATRSGGHLSRFRGRGMEFDESRVYQPGDDPRNMDWRVTARAGTPHVKLFREERERPVWLLVDQGSSMRFGTRVAFKSVVAAQAAALLGWSAVDRGDRVGGLVFDERGHLERRPAARGAGLLPLLDRLAVPPDASQGGYGSLAEAAEHLVHLVRPGSLVAAISDFADLREERSSWLTQLGAGSELLLILVSDPIEANVPPPGRYPVAIERRRAVLDLTDRRLRERYQRQFEQRLELLARLERRQHFHLLRLSTQDPVGPTLAVGLGARGALRARGRAR
ncbi:DUF58 domain-containing protein [Thiocystis violacea]|uniref:DUF58 domain-containing protein n=1 Tax=Thiocystis violacea TaxID=13725 RepID=UPI0019076EF8|nr:DUF58 domain-containing protein [Thiocystis violacea]MBK1722003.1 DUF58 domain-containing protein [Thiocystis violacea]